MMRALIVYDSVSPKKLTAKVAETIRQVMQNKGINVASSNILDTDPASVRQYDCLLAGSPTMYFRATSEIRGFLDSFHEKEFLGKKAAAFDTQLEGRFYGNAAKGIEKRLKKLGFTIVSSPLVTYVEGRQNQMRLPAGEIAKVKKWGEELADQLLV